MGVTSIYDEDGKYIGHYMGCFNGALECNYYEESITNLIYVGCRDAVMHEGCKSFYDNKTGENLICEEGYIVDFDKMTCVPNNNH